MGRSSRDGFGHGLVVRGSEVLLSGILAREMLARQRPTDVVGQSIGIGVFLEGPNQDLFFQHGGANAGYRCYLMAYLDRPVAFAFMTN